MRDLKKINYKGVYVLNENGKIIDYSEGFKKKVQQIHSSWLFELLKKPVGQEVKRF